MAGSVPGSFIVLAVRMWSAAETSSVDSIRQKKRVAIRRYPHRLRYQSPMVPHRASGSIGSETFDAHGNAHATTDAQGRQTLLCAAPFHFKQQGVENTGTRRPDRVADGNGAAIDIDD